MTTPLRIHSDEADAPPSALEAAGLCELTPADVEATLLAAGPGLDPDEEPPPLPEFDRATLIVDGLVVDAATGEVLGLEDDRPDAPWTINSVENAQWAGRKLAEADGALVGIQAQRVAVLHRLAVQENAARRHREWLGRRFGAGLETFARKLLAAAGWARKTADFTFVTVSFRETKGTTWLTDEARAWELADIVLPARAKRKICVTDFAAVVTELKRRVEAGDEFAEPMLAEALALVESSGPGETVTIDTGVRLKK